MAIATLTLEYDMHVNAPHDYKEYENFKQKERYSINELCSSSKVQALLMLQVD
jgi:hypothetical protein